MFHYRPKKMTIKSLLRDYNDYRALKQFYRIFNHYIKAHKELENLNLVSHNSLVNIVRQRPNRVSLHKKVVTIDHFWISTDDVRNHMMRLGSTGRGKSHFSHAINKNASYPLSNKAESALMLTNIETNELAGFTSLSVIMNDDYEILIQYKGNELFIYIYFTHPDYFVQLNYKDKIIDYFYSSFNQTIDIISNNIAFLLTIEKFNNDYKDILEQDISVHDKITLANMLNI
jgi:hypothetical protein